MESRLYSAAFSMTHSRPTTVPSIHNQLVCLLGAGLFNSFVSFLLRNAAVNHHEKVFSLRNDAGITLLDAAADVKQAAANGGTPL